MTETRVALDVRTGESGVLPFVDTELDRRARTFLVDTGAARTSIRTDADSAGYPSLGRVEARGASGEPRWVDEVQPEVFRLGDLALEVPRLRRGEHDILGLDLLGQRTLVIDLTAASLTLGAELTGDRRSLRRLKRGHVTLPITLGGHETLALFDTGADSSVIDAAFVAAHPERFTRVGSEDGYDAHGVKIPSEVLELDTAQVGPLELRSLRLAAFPFSDDMRDGLEGAPLVLGNDVIQRARWGLDLATAVWTCEPRQDPARRDP